MISSTTCLCKACNSCFMIYRDELTQGIYTKIIIYGTP